ncbi:MAG: hypothetical protein QW035_03035 [Candidatus Anstonellales archaeon]
MKILGIAGREIINSRGKAAFEAEIITDEGIFRGAAPSGASTGRNEAVEKRDGGRRWAGSGFMGSLSRLKQIGKKLVGKEFRTLNEFDSALIKIDGTKGKSRLGSELTTALSAAFFKAQCPKPKKMPIPMFNIINGGVHGGSGLAIQEFMAVPQEKTFKEAVVAGCEIYTELRKAIEKKYGRGATGVGDEGGFIPPLRNSSQALDLICSSAEEAGRRFKIALDAAANSFFSKGNYLIDGKKLSPESLLEHYRGIISSYPVMSIEDPFAEGHEEFFGKLNNSIKVIGDDITVTSKRLIIKNSKNISGVIIKINQVGTVTEAIEAVRAAKQSGIFTVVSHRSGETEDLTISLLSAWLPSDYIKSGAPARERAAKYNELIRLEECL